MKRVWLKRSTNKDHTSHLIDMMLTRGIGQDCQRLVHQGRDRHRYNVTDRRYRYDGYLSSYSDQLTPSQEMEAKLFLDKIANLDGSNNKQALNYLAQCEEAAQKMNAPETTVAWSKLSGRVHEVMREESREHEGTVTWEVFQSMLIEHFYHILSKERAAKLLNKLQKDPHESIREYVQR